MATNRWLGHGIATAQVVTLTVGSATNTETFITTMNGKSITYVAGAAETTSTVATAIHALLSASQIPEFLEVTWTVSAAVVTGTAATAGIPFEISESGTGTYTLATATASSGPEDVSITSNWSLGTLPAAAEDILVDGGPDLLYGWAGIAAAAYATLRIKGSFEGKIGLSYRNPLGYIEYRARSWPIATAVAVTIGEGDGQGPSRVNLTITTAVAVIVLKTQTRLDPATPVVNIAGNSSGTVVVAAGDVGLAADNDTLSGTVTTGTLGGDGFLTVGKGATVTTLNQNGGGCLNLGTTTTLNLTGGTFDHSGVALTTVTADPAPDSVVTFYWSCGATITTATFRGQVGSQGPVLDCSRDPRTRTLTNGTVSGGAKFFDPDKLVTFSNAITTDRASLVVSDFGARFTMSRT